MTLLAFRSRSLIVGSKAASSRFFPFFIVACLSAEYGSICHHVTVCCCSRGQLAVFCIIACLSADGSAVILVSLVDSKHSFDALSEDRQICDIFKTSVRNLALLRLLCPLLDGFQPPASHINHAELSHSSGDNVATTSYIPWQVCSYPQTYLQTYPKSLPLTPNPSYPYAYSQTQPYPLLCRSPTPNPNPNPDPTTPTPNP